MPKKLFRILRGGPLNGTTYELPVTPINLEIGYVLGNYHESEDPDTTMIYLFATKESDGETETHYFDYFQSMPNAEAMDWMKRRSAHLRN